MKYINQFYNKGIGNKSLLIFCLFFFMLSLSLSGHVIAYDLKKLGKTGIAWLYLKAGVEHIIPLGLDHILFIVSLYLLNPKLKAILKQATIFTVAHSVTLGLSLSGIISPPSYLVEPIIALSIAFVAAENIITNKLKPARLVIVFLFGLIHGMGFASALQEAGLPPTDFFTSLILFNVGVEIGQVLVILLLYVLIVKWFSDKSYYRSRIVIPLSLVICLIAMYWVIERIFS